jgi:hypothetical protein
VYPESKGSHNEAQEAQEIMAEKRKAQRKSTAQKGRNAGMPAFPRGRELSGKEKETLKALNSASPKPKYPPFVQMQKSLSERDARYGRDIPLPPSK